MVIVAVVEAQGGICLIYHISGSWKCTPCKSISQSLEGRLEDDGQAEALHEAKHCI